MIIEKVIFPSHICHLHNSFHGNHGSYLPIQIKGEEVTLWVRFLNRGVDAAGFLSQCPSGQRTATRAECCTRLSSAHTSAFSSGTSAVPHILM